MENSNMRKFIRITFIYVTVILFIALCRRVYLNGFEVLINVKTFHAGREKLKHLVK